MTPEQTIERGRMAGEVLNNPVYQESYEKVEQGVIAAWREAGNEQDRERLWLSLKMLAKVRTLMESDMRTGEIEVKTLQQKQTIAARLGRKLSGD